MFIFNHFSGSTSDGYLITNDKDLFTGKQGTGYTNVEIFYAAVWIALQIIGLQKRNTLGAGLLEVIALLTYNIPTFDYV